MRTTKSSSKSSKLPHDVAYLIATIRLIAENNTNACTILKKNAKLYLAHVGGKPAEYAASAMNGKDFTAHGKTFWVHSAFSPLVYPYRDKSGDVLLMKLPSLKAAWDAAQRAGVVKTEWQAVTNQAVSLGVVKMSWQKAGTRSFPTFAVTEDLPERTTPEAVKSVGDSALLAMIQRKM